MDHMASISGVEIFLIIILFIVIIILLSGLHILKEWERGNIDTRNTTSAEKITSSLD